MTIEANNRAPLYAVGTVLLLLIVTTLLVLPPVWDPYSPKYKPYRGILNALPVEDMLPLKMRHVQQVPAFDTGLFGNSRTYPVGSDHMGVESGLFNFSIGSQSFRNNVRMVKALSDIGKLPKTVILQFNHAEISFDNEAPLFPRNTQFVIERLQDAWNIRAAGRSVKTALVHVYNIGYHETDRVLTAFNARYILTRVQLHCVPIFKRLNAAFGWKLGQGGNPTRYVVDGSRLVVQPIPTRFLYRKGKRNNDYPLLESDFEMLVEVARRHPGLKVLIYETPIISELATKIEEELSANAKSVRERVAALCEQAKFRCVTAPRFPHTAEDPWADSNHPPARLLGRFLASELALLNEQ